MTDREVRAVTRALRPNSGFFLAAIVVGIILPKVAAFGYLVIAALAVLRAGDWVRESFG